jgi:tRNA (guanosine-2'-O-)-methyltransferase
MAIPETDHYQEALSKGDTLVQRPCIHWVDAKLDWIDRERRRGATVIGVELDEDSIPLARLEVARRPTCVLLGHEHSGLPQEVWPFLDAVIEIPMLGVGRSLNVAVAGSLVLYKLAGLS